MDKITKQAIIWFIIILFGGGLISLALGQGFWGEKREPQRMQIQPTVNNPKWQWGPNGPNMNEKCDTTKPCKECHPEK